MASASNLWPLGSGEAGQRCRDTPIVVRVAPACNSAYGAQTNGSGGTAAAVDGTTEAAIRALVGVGPATCGDAGLYMTHQTVVGDLELSLRYHLRPNRPPGTFARLEVRRLGLGTESNVLAALQVPTTVDRGEADCTDCDGSDYAEWLGSIVSAAVGVDKAKPAPSAATKNCASSKELVWNQLMVPSAHVNPHGGVSVGDFVLVERPVEEPVMVLQPCVYPQYHPNCCGYHALHNATTCLRFLLALDSSSDTTLQEFGASLCTGQTFWSDLIMVLAELRQTMADAGRPKRDIQELETTVLEREHVSFLPKVLAKVFPDVGANITVVPDMSNNWSAQWKPFHDKLLELMDTAAKLKQAGGSKMAQTLAHAFVLGCYKHWVCAVVHGKVRDAEDTKWEILLFDSANKPAGLILPNEAALAAEVAARKAKGSEWEVKQLTKLQRCERFRYRSLAQLRAVVEDGEPEYSQPGTKWERPRPAMYWDERPRSEEVNQEMLELRSTHCYIRAMQKVLAGEATGESIFLDRLTGRWIDEFERETLLPQPDGSFRWVSEPELDIRSDGHASKSTETMVAAVEKFSATPGQGRGGVANLVETIESFGAQHISATCRRRLQQWCASVQELVDKAEAEGVALGKTVSLRSAESGTPYILKFRDVMQELAVLIA
eukprot:SAG31_NODE_1157_length_9612_cov_6.630401_7_plen_661_part_00